MLYIAFSMRAMQGLRGGPDWVAWGDLRYNVEAKAEDPAKATEAELLQMLQAFLIERFQMKYHFETKETSGFALMLGKNGPKLKESKSELVDVTFSPTFKPVPGQPVTLTARRVSMEKLAAIFTQTNERPVIDSTGLAGAYDFTLSWDETAGPTLSTALQQQLGLRFESQKVPISTMVLESAQKPPAN